MGRNSTAAPAIRRKLKVGKMLLPNRDFGLAGAPATDLADQSLGLRRASVPSSLLEQRLEFWRQGSSRLKCPLAELGYRLRGQWNSHYSRRRPLLLCHDHYSNSKIRLQSARCRATKHLVSSFHPYWALIDPKWTYSAPFPPNGLAVS